MQSSPASRHFLPLRSKYSPQHPVLKNPQSMRFPQCERSSFKPVQRLSEKLRDSCCIPRLFPKDVLYSHFPSLCSINTL
jgi:hypothetical protein